MTCFMHHLARIKPLVDARISDLVGEALDDPNLITILTRGKRLRAGVLTMLYEHLCPFKSEQVIDLAVAIELAHAASLILDDMLDEDETRRGVPAHHITTGQKRAMLDTVGVLSMPYALASVYGKGYVSSLAKTQQSMVKGVISEMLKEPALPASKLYDAIITQKTGKLFSLAALWAYWASVIDLKYHKETHLMPNDTIVRWWVPDKDLTYDPVTWENCEKWGLHVGKAMQAADDIADLKAVMTGKKKGHLGTEAILLRCLTADQLARDLVSDVKHGKLDISRARELWNSEGVQKALHVKLIQEIDEANVCILKIEELSPLMKQYLYPVARDIACIMLNEV